MLLNGPKLLEFLGKPEAPVALQCKDCGAVTVLRDRWIALQDEGLEELCECGTMHRIPRYSPRLHYPKPLRVSTKRGRMVTLLGYAAVAAVGWQIGRRASGSLPVPSEIPDD